MIEQNELLFRFFIYSIVKPIVNYELPNRGVTLVDRYASLILYTLYHDFFI
jgi:hypothetical protein